MSVPDFELIVLDFDGTLADTRPAIIATILATFADEARVSLSAAAVEAIVSRGLPLDATLRATAIEHGLSPDAIGVARLIEAYREIYARYDRSSTRLFDGFASVLATLRSRGALIGVVSNKGEAAIHAFLERNQIAHRTDLVFGDVNGRPRKPASALMFEHVLPRAGIEQLDRILVVGDTEIDLQFALNCGVSSCWARFGYGDPAVCMRHAPTYVIDYPSQLLSLPPSPGPGPAAALASIPF